MRCKNMLCFTDISSTLKTSIAIVPNEHPLYPTDNGHSARFGIENIYAAHGLDSSCTQHAWHARWNFSWRRSHLGRDTRQLTLWGHRNVAKRFSKWHNNETLPKIELPHIVLKVISPRYKRILHIICLAHLACNVHLYVLKGREPNMHNEWITFCHILSKSLEYPNPVSCSLLYSNPSLACWLNNPISIPWDKWMNWLPHLVLFCSCNVSSAFHESSEASGQQWRHYVEFHIPISQRHRSRSSVPSRSGKIRGVCCTENWLLGQEDTPLQQASTPCRSVATCDPACVAWTTEMSGTQLYLCKLFLNMKVVELCRINSGSGRVPLLPSVKTKTNCFVLFSLSASTYIVVTANIDMYLYLHMIFYRVEMRTIFTYVICKYVAPIPFMFRNE